MYHFGLRTASPLHRFIALPRHRVTASLAGGSEGIRTLTHPQIRVTRFGEPIEIDTLEMTRGRWPGHDRLIVNGVDLSGDDGITVWADGALIWSRRHHLLRQN